MFIVSNFFPLQYTNCTPDRVKRALRAVKQYASALALFITLLIMPLQAFSANHSDINDLDRNTDMSHTITTTGDTGTLVNNATINAHVVNGATYGMHITNNNLLSNTRGELTNTGTIKVSSIGVGNAAYGMQGEAQQATGSSLILTNSGAIDATSESIVQGMMINFINAQGADNRAFITNSGIIKAQTKGAKTEANGIYISSPHANITNTASGIIEAIGAGGDISGIYGLALGNNALATLTNDGTITVTNSTGESSGMRVSATTTKDVTASLINSGIITVNGNDDVYGLNAAATVTSPNANFTLHNSGTINAIGTGSHAYGMNASFITSDFGTASLTNTGTINASTTNANGTAYGMYVNGGVTVDVSNTGTIHVSGANAYELGVDVGATANVKAWNLKLRSFSDTSQKPFHVSGGTLHFDDTLLYVGGNVGGIYRIQDMVLQEGTSTVTGRINSIIKTQLPMLSATLYGDSWDNQYISVELTPEESQRQAATTETQGFIQGQALRVASLLGKTLNDDRNSELPWQMFAQPYYAHQERTGSSAYSADSTGFLLGGNRNFAHGSVGVHLGIEGSNAEIAHNTGKVKNTTFIFGGHGLYDISHEWYVRGQVSGIVGTSENRFEDYSGNKSEDTTTQPYGVLAAVFSGYKARITSSQTLIPEIGILNLWNHMPSMAIKYANPDLNSHHTAQDLNSTYGLANVRWVGDFTAGKVRVAPFAAVGIRQTLATTDTTSTMNFQDKSFTTTVKEDRTLGQVEAGLKVIFNENVDISINYMGEFGQKTTSNMGWAMLNYNF